MILMNFVDDGITTRNVRNIPFKVGYTQLMTLPAQMPGQAKNG